MPCSKYEERRAGVCAYLCISIVELKLLTFLQTIALQRFVLSIGIGLRRPERTRIVYQKPPRFFAAASMSHDPRQKKRPASRAVSPCGSRGLSPQIVLQPVFAPDAATGIGLSIYFRFGPFITIAG